MPSYIDADALIEDIRKIADDPWNGSIGASAHFRDIADFIEDFPTADVVEVKDLEQRLNDAYKHGYSDCLSELPSAQAWIPVAERLPKKDGHYLCTYESDGRISVNIGRVINGEWTDWYVTPTAWMPLPEPWKGDRK